MKKICEIFLDVDNIFSKIGLLLIDLAIAAVCWRLLQNNYKRRKEVVETIKNCSTALGFDQPGVYIIDKSINPTTIFRPWFRWFAAGLIATIIGIALILFIPRKEKPENSININLHIDKDSLTLKKDLIQNDVFKTSLRN